MRDANSNILTKIARARRRVPSWRALAKLTLATLILLILNDQILRWMSRHNPSSRVNWLFLQPSTEYDIAILGSSISKEGIDPIILADGTNQSVVQLAWGGRGVSEQALYLELFLERHHCKTLLLELHPRGLEEDVLPHPLDAFRYIGHLSNPTVRHHLQRHFGAAPTVAWRWVPMLAMAQFSTQIGWHDLLAWRRNESFDPNAPADNNHDSEVEELLRQKRDPSKATGRNAISSLSVAQFEDILRICSKHQVRIVALEPPIFQGLGEAEKLSHEKVPRYAGKRRHGHSL